MFRFALLFGLAAGALVAGEFAGRWAGTMETNGARYPIYITLSESNGSVSGSVTAGFAGSPLALENAELRDGGLSFQIRTNTRRVIHFHLSLADGVLGGEATVDGQVSKVAVVPANGGFGVRVPLASGVGTGDSGSGALRVGAGVSAPTLIYKVEPEYTEAARQAKYQGTVLLYTEINPDGQATNIKVQRSLGLGLDEKAIECVKQWRFKPGYKDGKPVTVAATIEVNFRL